MIDKKPIWEAIAINGTLEVRIYLTGTESGLEGELVGDPVTLSLQCRSQGVARAIGDLILDALSNLADRNQIFLQEEAEAKEKQAKAEVKK